jgi:hypothetical protein
MQQEDKDFLNLNNYQEIEASHSLTCLDITPKMT